MADATDRQALLSTLTTEHFTLQGARASVVGETGARSSLYLSAVSSALIALGFVAQASEIGETFRLFALAILPVLFLLGLVTHVRLLEKAIEEFYYARAINRIRSYYVELAGADARYFLLKGHDDAPGMFENMGLSSSRVQLVFTSASTIAIVNSVVAGAGTALLIGAAASAAPGLAVGCGAAATVALAIISSTSDGALQECSLPWRSCSHQVPRGERFKRQRRTHWNPRTSCPSRPSSRW